MRDDPPDLFKRERSEILPKTPLDRRAATLSSDTRPAPPLMVRVRKKRACEILERSPPIAHRRKILEPAIVQFLKIAVMRVERGTADTRPLHNITNRDRFVAALVDQRNERIA